MARRGEEGRMDPRHSWLQGVREHFRNQTRVITPWGHRGRSLPPLPHPPFPIFHPSLRIREACIWKKSADESILPSTIRSNVPLFGYSKDRMAWFLRIRYCQYDSCASIWKWGEKERVLRVFASFNLISVPIEYIMEKVVTNIFFFFCSMHQSLINNNSTEQVRVSKPLKRKREERMERLLSLKERLRKKIYIRRKERSSLKIPCQRDVVHSLSGK